jgi:hypothetical protein
MSQSVRGEAPAVTTTVATPGNFKPVDAKKLFVKLGIGKMPKVNSKPQLPSDFALTGRR